MLCGVLASTVILVNCQKAPNKPVKPDVKPAAKGQAVDATKMAVCTADILKELKSRDEAETKLAEKIKTAKSDSADDKNELTSLANALAAQTKKTIDLIKATPVGDDKKTEAIGCDEREGNDAKKKVLKSYVIAQIVGQVNGLGVKAKQMSGQENDITKGLGNTSTQKVGLFVGQKFKIGSELAGILSSDENSDGVAVVVDGKVLKGDNAKAALEQTEKTACFFMILASEEIKADATIEINAVMDVATSDDQKHKVLPVTLSRAADKEAGLESAGNVINMTCQVAAGKEVSAGSEAKAALGSLVTEIKEAAKKEEAKK